MSIRAKLISFLVRRTLKSQFDNIGDDVVAFRERMDKATGLSAKLPAEVTVEKLIIGAIDCEWVTFEEAVSSKDSNKVIMYLHGGGYVFGGLDSHREIAWRLAKEAGIKVLLVDYRLAPETRFPGAVEDATACYQYLLEQGYQSSEIVFGGDSAGGGLAVSTLVNLKNIGLPQPAGAVLLSPWVDLTGSGDSVDTNAEADPMLSRLALDNFSDLYIGSLDKKAALASPLFADLSGLPAMLVQASSSEILLSDAQRLVDKVNQQGGEAVLDIWPKMPHVFQVFAGRIPEGKVAIAKLADFIRQHTVE